MTSVVPFVRARASCVLLAGGLAIFYTIFFNTWMFAIRAAYLSEQPTAKTRLRATHSPLPLTLMRLHKRGWRGCEEGAKRV